MECFLGLYSRGRKRRYILIMKISLLSFDELDNEQKKALKQHAQKIAQKQNVDVKDVYNSFKEKVFYVIAGHLHFAVFHPISMLDID